LWSDFAAEIQDAFWVVRDVANVRNFQSGRHPIELGDGGSIRGRSDADLETLGFDAAVRACIAEDCSGFGASSFVLVVEHRFAKEPSKLDMYSVSSNVPRAIEALRLADVGSAPDRRRWPNPCKGGPSALTRVCPSTFRAAERSTGGSGAIKFRRPLRHRERSEATQWSRSGRIGRDRRRERRHWRKSRDGATAGSLLEANASRSSGLRSR